MEIVYLHQYFNTPQMPGGTRSYEMARRLVANGHKVHMVTSDRAYQDGGKDWYITREAGIIVYWLPVPYSNHMSYLERIRAFFRFAWWSAKRAASIPVDVVFATSTPLTIALPAVYAARRQKIPMVFEVRDLWPELPVAIGAIRNPILISLARLLERFAYRNATAVVSLSPGMRDGVISSGYLPERVSVIPNSCDLDLFQVSPEFGIKFRKRFEWLGNRPLVLYAGTFGRINGVGYLVQMAAAMQKIEPEICFLAVGGGHEVEKVTELAKELGVLEQNFYLLPSLPKEEMPALFSAATVSTSLFIDLPEMWANSANKFFDALAAGKPVAINYGGWQAALLQETGAGVVLPPLDYDNAARMLVDFIHDPERLQRAGVAAHLLAHERFNRDKLATELEQVLLDAVSDNKPSEVG